MGHQGQWVPAHFVRSPSSALPVLHSPAEVRFGHRGRGYGQSPQIPLNEIDDQRGRVQAAHTTEERAPLTPPRRSEHLPKKQTVPMPRMRALVCPSSAKVAMPNVGAWRASVSTRPRSARRWLLVRFFRRNAYRTQRDALPRNETRAIKVRADSGRSASLDQTRRGNFPEGLFETSWIHA